MKEAKFSEIWSNTIKPLIDSRLCCKQYYTAYGNKETEARRDIESWYNSLRDRVKTELMLQSDCRLDRHKICACLYKAIIERPVLKVLEGTVAKDRVVNAELAFQAACMLLFSFIMDDAKADSGFENFLKESKMLCFPKCRSKDSNDSYLVQTIKVLCIAQKNEELSILMLSNIFYLLEVCTEQAYRAKIST